MSYKWLTLLFLILVTSCLKDDLVNNFPADVRFDVSDRFLEGKHITAIATDARGNVFAAADKVLYFMNNNQHKSYDLDFTVTDIAISPDETVWIGSNGGGLGHLTNKGVKWYNVANSGFPRDYIGSVEVAPDGDVWFSSSAFREGGLGHFDGNKFEFLTPENSSLNQNIIEDIEIDAEGRIYIATSGTVTKTNIYRIDGNSWDCLGDEKGTFYWVFSFTLSPSGNIYLVEDFSLSSALRTNTLFEFCDEKWEKIDNKDIPLNGFFSSVKADKRNYCWISGRNDHSALLHVYNGNSWVTSPKNFLPDDMITVIESDSDNNIWIGTYNNGVFVLNQ
jgi:ligand-binding sensor domain-containing protein